MTKILDHGYLTYIEHWGSDERIIEAARMSTDKGFLGWGGDMCATCEGSGTLESPVRACSECKAGLTVGDEKLLKYLYENNHASPFEMAGCIIEVQAPIFVFREWHRHRTQSYNELSARYTTIPDLNYIPTVERLMLNANGQNKQAGTIKGAAIMTVKHAEEYREVLAQHYRTDQELYDYALLAGVPKEIARAHLPVGRYSRMRASANLRNWLGFMTLRADSKAQWEIQQYAWEVHKVLTGLFPRTMELFDAGRSART